MATDLYINFPDDFEERYKEYKAKILGAQQLTKQESMGGLVSLNIEKTGTENGASYISGSATWIKPKDPKLEVLKFDIPNGNIIFNGLPPCHIADIGDYQHHLCKELLTLDDNKEYKFGDWVTETYIEDSYSTAGIGINEGKAFKSNRWVKDSVYKINIKFKKVFGAKNLIEYKSARVRIIRENFE